MRVTEVTKGNERKVTEINKNKEEATKNNQQQHKPSFCWFLLTFVTFYSFFGFLLAILLLVTFCLFLLNC